MFGKAFNTSSLVVQGSSGEEISRFDFFDPELLLFELNFKIIKKEFIIYYKVPLQASIVFKKQKKLKSHKLHMLHITFVFADGERRQIMV